MLFLFFFCFGVPRPPSGGTTTASCRGSTQAIFLHRVCLHGIEPSCTCYARPKASCTATCSASTGNRSGGEEEGGKSSCRCLGEKSCGGECIKFRRRGFSFRARCGFLSLFHHKDISHDDRFLKIFAQLEKENFDDSTSQISLCHAPKIRISPKSKPSVCLLYPESKP